MQGMSVDRTTVGIAVSAANPRQSAVVPPEWRNAAGSNAVWTGELSLNPLYWSAVDVCTERSDLYVCDPLYGADD